MWVVVVAGCGTSLADKTLFWGLTCANFAELQSDTYIEAFNNCSESKSRSESSLFVSGLFSYFDNSIPICFSITFS